MGDLGLQVGTPRWESAGPIAFGPGNVVFLADNRNAKVIAVEVALPPGGAAPFDLEGVDARIAAYLGTSVDDIALRDLAVHPGTHCVVLSVQRGAGEDGQPVLIAVDGVDGSITDIALDNVPFAEIALSDAPALDDERLDTTLPLGNEGEEVTYGDRTFRLVRRPIRTATITDMAYVDGLVLVAGISNEEFASKLRRIPFPFEGAVTDNSLEIFHVSHGKWETAAPIRTFVPYEGGRSVLASYTCTPVVHFPLADLASGTKAVGRTVAELGPVNQPLDMVSFVQDGEEHVLVANSAHGLIKIACSDIDRQPALTEPNEPVGVPREVEDLKGIIRLANLNDSCVLALQTDGEGRKHLRSLKTADL